MKTLKNPEGQRAALEGRVKRYTLSAKGRDNRLKYVCMSCLKKVEELRISRAMEKRANPQRSQLVTSQIPKSEPMSIDNRGLLHTYLTKGIQIKQEETEEMEVKVDPMLFLQYSEDEQSQQSQDSNLSEQSAEIEEEERFYNLKEFMESGRTFEAEFTCSLCSRIFHTDRSLLNHTWCQNTKPETQTPPVVHKKPIVPTPSITPRKYDMGDDYVHDVVRYVCPVCGKLISSRGNLKIHLDTHRPKGKYDCDICGRSFKTQSNLLRHKEYHTGVQFTCNVCRRVYPTKSTLRAHSITHSNLRPHKCPLCDKTFKRNQDLKFHINQHTGARPYKCPYCPKAFASSGNCFSHRKRMHPLEVERDKERAATIVR
ncbi:PREDICTED: zinc finger protein with KRAB and SCAN domains 8-like isoform X2 [Nicrophorus vespilloides]|uniref:Zinc finger protein with KRAB and SCAN domains 8-like isoform X2 n=1 Tax=Nicrophorus vespilloides TaxID=110193 RepID=A0ABM1MK98_NICVS|nr:PREDICTED: zinc finger protein with KRAB and SCAN domains 8-like isoform X2 [Nicrophorus vespilloides]